MAGACRLEPAPSILGMMALVMTRATRLLGRATTTSCDMSQSSTTIKRTLRLLAFGDRSAAGLCADFTSTKMKRVLNGEKPPKSPVAPFPFSKSRCRPGCTITWRLSAYPVHTSVVSIMIHELQIRLSYWNVVSMMSFVSSSRQAVEWLEGLLIKCK